jgi:hypothetical protein
VLQNRLKQTTSGSPNNHGSRYTQMKRTWEEGIRGMMREKGLQKEDWTDRNNWRRNIA